MAILTAPKTFHGTTTASAEPALSAGYGRYLADVSGCHGCHGFGLSGGRVAGPPDVPIAANLTPAGLGAWTQADFVRAIREGRRPDGTSIHPFMPWRLCRHERRRAAGAVALSPIGAGQGYGRQVRAQGWRHPSGTCWWPRRCGAARCVPRWTAAQTGHWRGQKSLRGARSRAIDDTSQSKRRSRPASTRDDRWGAREDRDSVSASALVRQGGPPGQQFWT